MTLRELIVDYENTNAWAWMAAWDNPTSNSVIIRRHGQVFDVKSFDHPMSDSIDRVGWSGLSTDGIARWIGWDIDVAHGKKSASSFDEALLRAVRLWVLVDGMAEVRTSTSGQGLHVRHTLLQPLKNDAAIRLAKNISRKIDGIDPTPCGRQCFWFWDRDPAPGAFRQILPARGGHIDG